MLRGIRVSLRVWRQSLQAVTREEFYRHLPLQDREASIAGLGEPNRGVVVLLFEADKGAFKGAGRHRAFSDAVAREWDATVPVLRRLDPNSVASLRAARPLT